MAKTIKKITCPQCGSNNVLKHEHDYYVCNSCHTRFFLDTDDVTITHKHVTQSTPPPFNHTVPQKKYSVGGIIAIGLLVLITIGAVIFNIVNHDKAKSNGKEDFGAYESAKDEYLYSSSREKIQTVKIDNNKAVLVNVGLFDKYSLPDDKQDHIYVFVHELPSGKILKKIDLDVDLTIKGKESNSITDEILMFRDTKNRLFFIINKYYLFRFDEKTLEMVNVSQSYFEGIKELEVGIAGIDYDDRRLESFLQVTNNNGVKYAYSHDLGLIYKYGGNEYKKEPFSRILALELPNPTIETHYDFTKFNEKYNDKPIQLMKYNIKVQKGYFVTNVDFQWFHLSYYDWDKGVQVEGDKFGPSTYTEVAKRVVDYKDFTPDRKYVDKGKVLGEDKEGVIIAIKMSLLDSEPYTVQKLKHTDGSILWTQKTDWTYISEVFAQVSNDYLVVKADYRGATIIDTKTGEITDAFKFEYGKSSK